VSSGEGESRAVSVICSDDTIRAYGKSALRVGRSALDRASTLRYKVQSTLKCKVVG
jgi:hypothetical protein